MSDRMRMRQWAKLPYVESEAILRGIRKVYDAIDPDALARIPANVRTLRRRDLKKYGEGRQAALFCYGMSKVVGAPVWFAQHEDADHDIIVRWVRDGADNFMPVQLKEFTHLDGNSNLQQELNKIDRYADSQELAVVCFLNVNQRIEFDRLRFPTTIGEFWFFGSNTPDQSRWFLIGDMLRSQRYVFQFDYPR